MQKIMYRVTEYEDIQKLAVLKVTAKTVTAKIRKGWYAHREALTSSYQRWFDTWEEAKQYQLDRLEQRIERLEKELQRAKNNHAKFVGLSEPRKCDNED